MYKLLVATALVLSFGRAFAGEMVHVKCLSSDETIKISINAADKKEPHYVEIYNQGGMGPDFLEASYVASSSDFSANDKSLSAKAVYQGETLSFAIDKFSNVGSGEIQSDSGKKPVLCEISK